MEVKEPIAVSEEQHPADEIVAPASLDSEVKELPASGWGLLKTRNFGLLFAGQAISQIGDSMNKVALLWFVYELTGSAFKMTVIGLLQTIPPLVFGPLIGVYLDRLRKKPVMIWVDCIRAVLVLLIPLLYSLDALSLERLYLLVFATSIVSTIFGPALASSVPLIVSRNQLMGANALVQSTTNIGLLIGPAVSGAGIAMVGAQNVLYIDAATFFISALCLMPIMVREVPQAATRPLDRAGLIQDLLVGFRFVFVQHRTVLLLMLTATLYSLGASAFVFLLPVFATQLLDASPVELGWLWSSLGIGMLITSAWLAKRNQGDIRSRLQLVAIALAVGAVAVCTLGMLQAPIMAAVLIVVFGGSTAIFTPVVWAMLQELTPENLLGRVFTTFSTGAMASAMAGMAAFGWAADAIGPAESLLGIGLVLLGTAIVTAAFSRRYLHPTQSKLPGLMTV
ncbi:putative Permease, MFS family [Nitrospira sp. KM1]|uniref:MFS transporter n=1 Tax=Nitrospira sp. KM1 TaxID=1936990 RepID=UPI0013A7823D|nr:MFS transporter [Nitrospira sp. KM1]BCA56179.1 putative Permease, MFS family [Nitrospira sp. KM1]